jgi:DNA polymerase III subunit delta
MTQSMAIIGEVPSMVSDALQDVLARLLSDVDRSIALEEFDYDAPAAADDDEEESLLATILTSLNTPPFLVPTRVVVVRNGVKLPKSALASIKQWTENPLPGVTLILTGHVSKTAEVAKTVAEVIDTNVGHRAKEMAAFLRDTVAKYRVEVDGAVQAQMLAVIGEEVERIDPLVRLLANVYGTAPLKFSHIEPYLGDKGNVPEWDLTDAVDQGNAQQAVRVVARMLESEGREPVQIVGIFERHYLRVATLVGVEVGSPDQAVELLSAGGRRVAPFTAGKVLRLAQVLGADGVARALRSVADADRDIKGATKLDGATVVAILAARLARTTGAARRR